MYQEIGNKFIQEEQKVSVTIRKGLDLEFWDKN